MCLTKCSSLIKCEQLCYREGANSWSFGLAPPPPPGTPVNQNYRYHKPGINYSPLSSDAGGGGSSRSGISGGAIAGILISVIVVGAVLAYLLVKRRPKRSSTDIEKQKQKLGNLPSVSPASNEVQGNHLQLLPYSLGSMHFIIICSVVIFSSSICYVF